MIIGKVVQQQLSPYQLSLAEQSHFRYNPFISALTIEDLVINKNQQKMLAVSKLCIELNLLQLIFDKLSIKSFEINGLYTIIELVNNHWQVAGISLANNNAPDSSPSDEDKTPMPYQVIMPKLELSQSEILVVHPKQKQLIAINALTVSDVKANKDTQTATVQLQVAIEQSQLATEAKFVVVDNKVHIKNALSLDDFQLAQLLPWLPEEFNALSGALSVTGQQELDINDQKINIVLTDTHQSLEQLTLNTQGINFTASQQAFTSSTLNIHLQPEKPVLIDGEFNVKLTDTLINRQDELQQTLAAIAQVDTGLVAINTETSIQQLHLPKLTITNAVIAKNQGTQLPALTQFEQLTVTDIALSALGTKIKEISIAGLAADISLDSEKKVSNLQPFESLLTNKPQSNTTEQQPVAATKKAVPASNYPISIERFQFADDASIHFTDNSVDPAYERSFIIEKLLLGPIDTQQPDLVSKFSLAGKSNQYAIFDFNGFGKPLLPEPELQLTANLKELDLPSVSTYIKDALKYEIKSGLLNLAIQAELKGEQLTGETDILLQGIDLTAADDHQANSLSDKTAIPFSAAIGMLKDSDGNVELNIPLSGKTSDPSFGTSGIFSLLVKQATMMAAKEYLMTTFVPYAKVVSVALAAGNEMLKLRFNDLIFAPKQVTLSDEHQSFLEQFAALMKEKDTTQMTICAIAAPQDIDLAAGDEVNNKEDIKQLLKLAQTRLDNFKHRMVNDFQLKSSRLLLCTPQIDSSKGAKPRITFTSN